MRTKEIPVPKRHHHVPQFILRNFVNSEGMLHCYQKTDDSFFKAYPVNVFVKNYLYTKLDTVGGRGDASTETELAKQVEAPAAAVVEKILASARSGACPELSPTERDTWNYFFCVQMRRSVRAREGLDDNSLVGDAIEAFESRFRFLSETERMEFATPEVREQLVHNAWVSIIAAPLGELVDVLGKKGLRVLALADPKESYVIGSEPVLRDIPQGTRLDHPQASALFPIAKDVAVAFSGHYGQEDLVTLPVGVHGTKALREINLTMFRQSEMVASASRRLLESLRRKP